MFTDMVGYTALGQRNESLSLALVEEQRKLIRPILARHNGSEIKTIGDAFLVEFPNALDAIRCAYEIQRTTREYNVPFSLDSRIHLRVGLHLGDVVESQGDISGDAVNVASRVEPLAEDGGVCVTRPIYDSTHNKLDVLLVSMGMKSLKNVSEPMEVYKMVMPWEQTIAAERPVFATNRIAILPFRNMSPDPNDEYFAEGMTEEIISTVSGISGLKVISRTSVMGYKGATKKVGEIGRELEVGSVLEGSFRKAGNKIRVTTQLIDVAKDEHIWAQNYDRDLDDIFEVQSDVAKQVADALRVRILSHEAERVEKKPTESTKAFSFYLKGRFHWNKRGLDDTKMALEYFELAVREDPGFALGYVGQADCYVLLRSNYWLDPETNLEKGKSMVAKALELDPGMAEAHTTKAFILASEYNLRQAEDEFKIATELKPGYATAHQWYALILRYRLRLNEAQEEIERALELDPLSPIMHLNHGDLLTAKREFQEALEPYKRALDLGYEPAHGGLAACYGKLGMYDEMKHEMSLAVELMKSSYPMVGKTADASIAYFEGDKETVRKLLLELESHMQETFTSAYQIGTFYFFLGENDKGFEWLERSVSRREDSVMNLKWDWDLDDVRTDPRYLDLLKRLGLD
jgi:TolB-like protein/Tfp pilus assembly protein PilF